MRRKNIFKKIIIALLALFVAVCLLFVLPVLARETRAFFAKNEDDIIIFDSQMRQKIAKVDRKMAKNSYIVGEKTCEIEDLLPYNGVNMRLVKVINNYSRPVQVTSHEKTAYQRFIGWLEGRFGRLPGLFYALNIVKYEGERREMTESTVIECRFMLIEDKKDRFFGGDYCAYSGTMKRSDNIEYEIYDEDDRLLGAYSEKGERIGKHFDGDLGWLKSKAYNNYVSPIVVNDAFEDYE